MMILTGMILIAIAVILAMYGDGLIPLIDKVVTTEEWFEDTTLTITDYYIFGVRVHYTCT